MGIIVIEHILNINKKNMLARVWSGRPMCFLNDE
jgi:hypothetical protein